MHFVDDSQNNIVNMLRRVIGTENSDSWVFFYSCMHGLAADFQD
jgi:hypothetical protein